MAAFPGFSIPVIGLREPALEPEKLFAGLKHLSMPEVLIDFCRAFIDAPCRLDNIEAGLFPDGSEEISPDFPLTQITKRSGEFMIEAV